MAPALVAAIDAITRPLADKAYDTNPFRAVLAKRQIEPVIPSIRRRKPLIPHDATAYRQRNLIERMFCRLKDFRRLATRYDNLARNFLATAIIAATIIWWINRVRTLDRYPRGDTSGMAPHGGDVAVAPSVPLRVRPAQDFYLKSADILGEPRSVSAANGAERT